MSRWQSTGWWLALLIGYGLCLPLDRAAGAEPPKSGPPGPVALLGPPPPGLPADPTCRDADVVVDYSSGWDGALGPCG